MPQLQVKSSPILKWAGGKTQRLPTIRQNSPKELLNGHIDSYIKKGAYTP